jgi:8-oxo-dGTP pyrophosphatase MutT (NUDIX family)
LQAAVVVTDDVTIVQRQAARALLLTPEREILLLRLCLPGVLDPFWIAPGGGLEPGETPEQCLRRELQEEVGLNDFGALGPLVWMREHTFNWGGRRLCQFERYFVIHVEKFVPHMSDPIESAALDRFRWWPVTELANSQERLTPLALAQIATSYVGGGAPSAVDVEIVVDS